MFMSMPDSPTPTSHILTYCPVQVTSYVVSTHWVCVIVLTSINVEYCMPSELITLLDLQACGESFKVIEEVF